MGLKTSSTAFMHSLVLLMATDDVHFGICCDHTLGCAASRCIEHETTTRQSALLKKCNDIEPRLSQQSGCSGSEILYGLRLALTKDSRTVGLNSSLQSNATICFQSTFGILAQLLLSHYKAVHLPSKRQTEENSLSNGAQKAKQTIT